MRTAVARKAPHCAGHLVGLDSGWKASMTTRLLIFFAMAAMATAQSVGQNSMQSSAGGTNSYSGTASFGPAPMVGYAVTGAPYSVEEVSENVHVLADGTRITQKLMGRKVWRDSDGRARS